MYDVIVLGGGPGGYAAAIRASQLKGKVVLVEEAAMGGTCVLRGCIPSKIWLTAASMKEQAAKAADFGISLELKGFDCAAVVARTQGVSNDIAMGMSALLASNGIEVVTGRGVVQSAHSVAVGETVLEGKSIIVATGSRLAPCTIPGSEGLVLTTDELLAMTSLPGSVLVTDPGPIGVECAMLLATLGCQVVYALPGARILPDEDQDSAQRLASALRERGVRIMPRCSLERIENGECVLAGKKKEERVRVDKVLWSLREPVSTGFGLEELGVGRNSDGGISVDAHCATAVNGIYAAGDCTGGWMLSHVASAMAICAAENAMGTPSVWQSQLVSRAIWGTVQMGSVGLSEEQADRAGREVETGSFPYAINGYAMLRGEVDGAVKVVADAQTGEILGVHIVGSQASELIGEAVLAMQLECTVHEFARGFRVHPAFCETVVDGFRDTEGWALYLPKRG